MVTYEPTVEQDCSRGRAFQAGKHSICVGPKARKQVAPLGFWNLWLRRLGRAAERKGGCPGRSEPGCGKSLAFDPVLSADFFSFPKNSSQIFIIRHSL